MKIFRIVVKRLFILCLPVFLLTVSIGWATNSLWLYKYSFNKYGVGTITGLSGAELDKAASGLISYFNSSEEYISLTVIKGDQPFELFNEQEVIHLKDVKKLIWLDYWVLLGTLIYTLAYVWTNLFWQKRGRWRRLMWDIVSGSGFTLALMLALGLGTVLGFDQLFLQFHLISFTNELWQLDPTRDYLIMLFPHGFWYDATLFCALGTVGLAVILGGASGGHLLFNKTSTAA